MSLLNQSVPVPKAFQLSSINKGIQKKNGSLSKLYKQMCLHSNMDQSQQPIRKLKKSETEQISFLFFILSFEYLLTALCDFLYCDIFLLMITVLIWPQAKKSFGFPSQVQEGWLMGHGDTEDLWISRELHEEIECWHHVGWAGSSPRHYNQVQAWVEHLD